MGLAPDVKPRIRLTAVPGPDCTIIFAWHEFGDMRQILHVERVERIADERVDLDLPAERFEAGPTVLIGLVAGALGVTTSSTIAIVIGTVLSVVLSTAVSIGLSLLERALFGDKGQEIGQAPPQVTPIRQIVKQSTPRKRFIYGKALVGGAYSYLNKKPPYLISQFLVAAHRCEALDAVFINGFRCEFNSNGDATTPRFRPGGTVYLNISTRLGDPDQAIDSLLTAEFPSIPTTFRQRGQTTVTLKAYYGVDYEDHESVWGPAGNFAPLFLMRGKPVHDPRVYSSDVDDDTTWSYTDNWALCLADWMITPYGGRKKTSQVDWDAVSEEADLCDQGIGLSSGGSEARYTLNGGFQSDQNPFEVVEAMLRAAGESACLWRRGQFAPQADVPRDTVRTLTQADIVSGFQFRSARSRYETLNKVQSEFVFPGRDYKAAVTPPLVNSTDLAADGQELAQTISRPFVAGEERAQRLDKITLQRSRLGRELRIMVGIEHLELETGDYVKIEFADFPMVNGTYVIRLSTAGEMLRTMELTLQEAPAASLHEWDPTTEVQDTSQVEILNPEAV